MKQIYIDSRVRTKNSKSENDFSIELPRSFNVPAGVVAHIDDIVTPVSWRTVDERNQNCYIAVGCEGPCKKLTLLVVPTTTIDTRLQQLWQRN